MSNEFDKEITTKKVSSDANTTGEGYTVSKQRTTRVNNDNANTGLIFGILAILSLGVGAGLYFMSSRPNPVQILAPTTTEPAKENNPTIIERNNTTIREVQPAAPQPAAPQPVAPQPKVEVNVPAPAPAAIIINPPAAAPAPVATPAATPAPAATTPASTPTPTPQTATPAPATTPAN